MIKCQINIAGEASRKVIWEPAEEEGREKVREAKEDTQPEKEKREGQRETGGKLGRASREERIPGSGS